MFRRQCFFINPELTENCIINTIVFLCFTCRSMRLDAPRYKQSSRSDGYLSRRYDDEDDDDVRGLFLLVTFLKQTIGTTGLPVTFAKCVN